MTQALVTDAESVLHFWLEEVPPERRFARDDDLDAEIRRRFAPLLDRLSAEGAADWTATVRTLLAAVIVLDQFSRNLNRGSPAAYANDAAALALSRHALARGWQLGLTVAETQFLFMPFMHSEALADQHMAVALYEALGEPVALDFARRHCEQIERFGRFPQRNAPLGRQSTAEEIAFLAQPGAAF